MSVIEMEQAIERLPASEVGELMTWFENYYHKVWDTQIAADLEAGTLDDLLPQ